MKVIKKVNQRRRYIHRISSLVTKSTLKTLIGALIQPHYDYACTSWYTGASKVNKNRLQTSQNKLVRLLLDLTPLTHLTPDHFAKVGWLRVDDRVKQLSMCLVYKIHHTSLIPKYLSQYFQNVCDRHDHNTRGSSINHVKPRFKTNLGLSSFTFYATTVWNALPRALKECATLPTFKVALKEHLQMAAIKDWPP